MTLDEVKQHFGTCASATRAIGVTRQAWTIWKKTGHVPITIQFIFERITGGKLVADIKHTNYRARANDR